MNLSELVSDFENDFTLTQDGLSDKLFSIPSIHSKWLGRHFRERIELIKVDEELSNLYRIKAEYYRKNYDYPIKSEKMLDTIILNDEEYSKLNSKYKRKKAIVDFLGSVVDKCKNLTFDIKNLIEYKKFVNGG
jgi:hypothetical protein